MIARLFGDVATSSFNAKALNYGKKSTCVRKKKIYIYRIYRIEKQRKE